MKDQGATDWLSAPAYVWDGTHARPVAWHFIVELAGRAGKALGD